MIAAVQPAALAPRPDRRREATAGVCAAWYADETDPRLIASSLSSTAAPCEPRRAKAPKMTTCFKPRLRQEGWPSGLLTAQVLLKLTVF